MPVQYHNHMPSSLCPGCVHVRLVAGRRDQTYLLCRNEAIPHKYPPQPVVTCAGYEQRLMGASDLEGLLKAHAFLRVERPPELWAPAAELESFVRLLGEMISAGLVRNGGVLAEITLNVAKVTVEPSDESPVPAGDFVAISIVADGDWRPETTWPDASAASPFVNTDLDAAARRAGARYGYTRALGDRGSVTVFFDRA